jgi:hypothetical protein
MQATYLSVLGQSYPRNEQRVRKHNQIENMPRLPSVLETLANRYSRLDDATLSGAASGSVSPHTHPQSQITGLTSALAGKAATAHTQAAATITDFSAAVKAVVAPYIDMNKTGGGTVRLTVGANNQILVTVLSCLMLLLFVPFTKAQSLTYPVIDNTTHVLQWPSDFWSTNAAGISAVVPYQPTNANLTLLSSAGTGSALQFLRKASDNATMEWATITVEGGGVASVSGSAPIVSSGGATPDISISAATTIAAGSMSAADKTKLDGIATGATVGVASTRTISTTAPLTGGGDLSANRTFAISAASGSAAGSMSSAHYTKLEALNAANYQPTNSVLTDLGDGAVSSLTITTLSSDTHNVGTLAITNPLLYLPATNVWVQGSLTNNALDQHASSVQQREQGSV